METRVFLNAPGNDHRNIYTQSILYCKTRVKVSDKDIKHDGRTNGWRTSSDGKNSQDLGEVCKKKSRIKEINR